MGFPVCYTELHFPKLLLLFLSLLCSIRKLISTLLTFLGLRNFLEPESPSLTRPEFSYMTQPDPNLGFIRKLILGLHYFLEPSPAQPEFSHLTRPEQNMGFIRKLIRGLHHFLEPEYSNPARPVFLDPTRPELTRLCLVSAGMIRELLPVVRFSKVVDPPEKCAVCLYEFELEDETRRLTNCCHVFHRSCVDRWIDHDQNTCPLCRKEFIPEDMMGIFNEKLWLASCISDFYEE